MEKKNVSELTITELKALVYDHLANIENSQSSIRVINEEISKRNQAQVTSNGIKPEVVEAKSE